MALLTLFIWFALWFTGNAKLINQMVQMSRHQRRDGFFRRRSIETIERDAAAWSYGGPMHRTHRFMFKFLFLPVTLFFLVNGVAVALLAAWQLLSS
jgi:hypothetical protein